MAVGGHHFLMSFKANPRHILEDDGQADRFSGRQPLLCNRKPFIPPSGALPVITPYGSNHPHGSFLRK